MKILAGLIVGSDFGAELDSLISNAMIELNKIVHKRYGGGYKKEFVDAEVSMRTLYLYAEGSDSGDTDSYFLPAVRISASKSMGVSVEVSIDSSEPYGIRIGSAPLGISVSLEDALSSVLLDKKKWVRGSPVKGLGRDISKFCDISGF